MKYLCVILLATSVAGRFTEELYQLLAKDNPDKNLIVSPLSAEIAMTMLYMGAEGKTAEEIRSVLELSNDKNKVASEYREFLGGLQKSGKDVTLELANRIYVNDQYSLVPEYNRVLKESFKAEAVQISIADPNKAAALVNNWVTEQTRGKIKEIVIPEDINPDLSAVLLNAIYFKGQWKHKFNEKLTTKIPFKVSKYDEIPVHMMFQNRKFMAADLNDLDAKVVELPYHNSNLSMLIFLPNKVDGLSELEDKIIGFSRPLFPHLVSLLLPRFKIEFEQELSGTLALLGIQDAFDAFANFQGIVQKSPLSLADVIQKAFIEVNEEGAEAAAVTATQMSRMSQRPLDFIADHPFAYIIRDEKTVYFQGHVVKP